MRASRVLSSKLNIVFLGAPGVGKGTFASRVAPALGIPTLSTGDIIRGEIKAQSPLAAKLKEYNDKGLLVPDELVFQMLKNKVDSLQTPGFLLDGFPRTVPQAEMLDGYRPINLVMNITLAEDILMEKLCGRRVCDSCGDNYNIANIKRGEIDMPPLLPKKAGCCDKCGGHLVQRKDDSEEVISNRLKIYKESTMPLVDYYTRKNVLVDFSVKKGIKDLPELLALMKQRLGLEQSS
eukprot:GILI01021161.1.p1 GENE.GILI01021161.1~~GILI01021161.1.p1  ORF type:complete len:236 (+),score=46.50 GILI01021161.1:100-807(+)